MDDPQAITTLMQNFGTPTAIVGFFLWWAYKREMRLLERIEKLDEFQKNEMAGLIRETTAALTEFAATIRSHFEEPKEHVN